MKKITLQVGGNRNVPVQVEEAKTILKRFEQQLAKAGSTVEEEEDGGGEGTNQVVVTKIDVSCRQWTAEAIEILKPLLSNVSVNVEIIDMSDIIAGLETSIGLNIMALFAETFLPAAFTEGGCLTTLLLNDNAMGPRALKVIEPLLKAPKLQVMYFSNCGLSAETITQLDEGLKKASNDDVAAGGGGGGVARLSAWNLDRNMIGLDGAKAVSKLLETCPKMKYFSYCGCRPLSEGTQVIVDGLYAMVNNHPDHPLEQLRLWDCSIGSGENDDDAIHTLSKMLAKTSHLTHLNLNDAGELGEAGTALVVQPILESGCKLVDLNLSGCCLGVDGAEVLVELITKMIPTLKVLSLEMAELEDDGVAKILSAFDDETDNVLEELRLSENELEEASLDALLNANLPKLRLLTLKDNMELEGLDDKKAELKAKFSKTCIFINDDDEEEEIREDQDADVDALADQLAGSAL